MHTFTRRCWGLRGQRVVIPKQQCYQWEYVYGAVEVMAGDTEFQFLPSVSLPLSGGFLQQIADSDPTAAHVVIWDGAGFHPTCKTAYMFLKPQQHWLEPFKVDQTLWKRHVDYLNHFLRKPSHEDVAENLKIGERLTRARRMLEQVESPDYLQSLAGTLGAEPVENYL